MPDDLITRIESAGPDKQRVLLWEAFRRLDREAPPARYSRFKALHDAEAYLDAALMLFPGSATGWTLASDCGAAPMHQAIIFRDGDGAIGTGDASTPALALLAAILKAKGPRP